MSQRQCPWCGHLGARYSGEPGPGSEPHADGSSCVCRHVTADSRAAAWHHGGRYWDGRLARWVCMGGCEPNAATIVPIAADGSRYTTAEEYLAAHPELAVLDADDLRPFDVLDADGYPTGTHVELTVPVEPRP